MELLMPLKKRRCVCLCVCAVSVCVRARTRIVHAFEEKKVYGWVGGWAGAGVHSTCRRRRDRERMCMGVFSPPLPFPLFHHSVPPSPSLSLSTYLCLSHTHTPGLSYALCPPLLTLKALHEHLVYIGLSLCHTHTHTHTHTHHLSVLESV